MCRLIVLSFWRQQIRNFMVFSKIYLKKEQKKYKRFNIKSFCTTPFEFYSALLHNQVLMTLL